MKASNMAKKILVVEDEPSISSLCQRVLEGEGFKVDTAVNGKVAQGRVSKKRYDLLLIDLKIPTMDGKVFFRWLEEKHPRVVDEVIFTTGDVMGGDTQLFLEQAARPLLPKPFTPSELKNIVRTTFERLENDCIAGKTAFSQRRKR